MTAAQTNGPCPVGRREVLAGLALSQIVTVTPLDAQIAGAAQLEGWKGLLATSREVDAQFWALHDRWKRIDAHWQADLDSYPGRDMPDSVMDAWGEKHHVAEYMMLTARILTLPALYAKMTAIKDEPANFLRHEEDGTLVFDAVMWDVERLIAKAGAA